MDLSHNNLSGRIPEFFESLSSLQFLNLSFNDLEGPVPEGGVFTNSSVVFIQGNSKLCATSSPNLQVPLCSTSPHKRKRTSYIVAIAVPLAIMVAVTLGCALVIVLKNTSQAKQLTDQSAKLMLKNFSYTDLFKTTDGFSANSLVGSGTFGMVYKGQFEFELCPVAIKVFRLQQLGAPSNFISECEALRNIRHRNLIRVISLCSTFDPTGTEFKALILEYMSNGNLEGWLHPKMFRQTTKRSLGLGSRITIAVNIAAALDYLHNRCTPPLVHCDLKPSNVLLDAEMVAHLSDFGLAKFLSNGSEFRNSSSIAGPRGSTGYIEPGENMSYSCFLQRSNVFVLFSLSDVLTYCGKF